MNSITDLVGTLKGTIKVIIYLTKQINDFPNKYVGKIDSNGKENNIQLEVEYRSGVDTSLPIFFDVSTTSTGPFDKTLEEIRVNNS